MQILRTRGARYQGWGGYLSCSVYPLYLPTMMFRYMPKTSTKFLTYIVGIELDLPDTHSDMPIGMSADACIQYWFDL